MSERAFRLTSIFVPYLLCTIVPTIFYGLVLGQWGTKLVWGHVFGFGWFIAQTLLGPEHWKTAALIGVFVWPPIILALLWIISGKVWRVGTSRMRSVSVYIIAATSLASVPAQTIECFYTGRGVPADFNVLWNAY